jgi:hypothetical protein
VSQGSLVPAAAFTKAMLIRSLFVATLPANSSIWKPSASTTRSDLPMMLHMMGDDAMSEWRCLRKNVTTMTNSDEIHFFSDVKIFYYRKQQLSRKIFANKIEFELVVAGSRPSYRCRWFLA